MRAWLRAQQDVERIHCGIDAAFQSGDSRTNLSEHTFRLSKLQLGSNALVVLEAYHIHEPLLGLRLFTCDREPLLYSAHRDVGIGYLG